MSLTAMHGDISTLAIAAGVAALLAGYAVHILGIGPHS